MDNKVKIFEDKKIRTAWNEEKEEWYFSVVDVVSVLTDSADGRKYWNKLKQRLKEEGNETVTNCHQLKMTAADGKNRITDVVDTTNLLRLIQSIPSPKAEPFKMWLAEVGKERIDETIDPELTIERALETYLKKGYTREWINQRLQAIQVRKELTDEWELRGVQKGIEYAILTDEITKAWSGMSKSSEPKTFKENLAVAKSGGEIAGQARENIEKRTGKPVITSKNATELNKVVTDLIEGITEENK